MNDVSSQWPFHFTLTYSKDEQRIFRKVMAARYAWGGQMVWALAVGLPLVIGLVVLGAFELGFIAVIALPSVLFSAYVAFTAGMTSYYFFLRRHFRKFYREDARTTWNYLFDDNGITYKSETMEVRLTWQALDSVEDRGRLVLLLFNGRGIGIPSRIFAGDAARAAFVTAVAACIRAATERAQT